MSYNVLYISASSKPEDISTSKTVGRYMLNQFIQKYPDSVIEELDLYNIKLPLINHKLLSDRGTLPTIEEFEKLNEEEKENIRIINGLSDQFLKADRYIISAPLWNMFFPSILKQYLDCIIIQGKFIEISAECAKGLLWDKERKMVYIQSCGGCYPYIVSSKLNQGAKYLEDIFSFLGISCFKKILVEGVTVNKIGKTQAIAYAKEDIDHLLKRY